MTSTGKRRKSKPRPKKGSPKKVPRKRNQNATRAKPAPARARTRTRTRESKKRSTAAKKGWATRRLRQERHDREIREGLQRGPGDEWVQTGSYEVDDDYEPYPVKLDPHRAEVQLFDEHGEVDHVAFFSSEGEIDHDAFTQLQEMGDRALDVHGEIEWFPRFDEVYDYIDALVDEYDLDAHELFEMAFGYSSDEAA
jgi:hypothetical protein